MCKLAKNGGRCAAHTRVDYQAALALVATERRSASSLFTLTEAAYEHACTPKGSRELAHDIKLTRDDLLKGVLEDAYTRARAESGKKPNMDSFALNPKHRIGYCPRLALVTAAVNAVKEGANTETAIGQALGKDTVPQWHGKNYALAAGHLGLISTSGYSRIWTLTPAGAEFLNASPADRVAILSDLIKEIPEESKEDSAHNLVLSDWYSSINSAQLLENQIDFEAQCMWGRINEARDTAAQERRQYEEEKRAEEEARKAASRAWQVKAPRPDTCDKCWTIPSAMGDCLCV